MYTNLIIIKSITNRNIARININLTILMTGHVYHNRIDHNFTRLILVHEPDVIEYFEFCCYVHKLVRDKGIAEAQLDAFSGYVPFGECGVHTIKEIKVYNVVSVEKLL